MSDQRSRESLLLPIVLPLGTLLAIGLVLFGFSRILLKLSNNAATVVACVTAASVLGVATFVATRKRVSGAALFPMVGMIAGIALLSGGVALVAVGPEKVPVQPQNAALTAPPDASTDGYAQTELSLKSNTPTTLLFNNQEVGVQHNVVIFQGKDDSGQQMFAGELTTGPQQQPYAVPPLPAGTYFFHCEIHPVTMTGTIAVAASGGQGGGGGIAIKAANLAFDTNKLTMPADTPTPLEFTNDDAGTTHNFAVYKDSAYTQSLFTGDLTTGPETTTYQLPSLAAGTYYFKCDVHPDMNGTLVVRGPDKGGGSAKTGPSASPSG